jgi:dipeptidyl aminopeptidase/acylaminoacyl peptidase
MTSTERFDWTVADWLRVDARHHVPDHLAETLALTSQTRQRPWWSSHERWLPLDTTFARRMPSMRPAWFLAIVLAVLVAIVAIAVVGSRAKPVPAPFGLAANGQIAFFSVDGDIVVSEADGTNVHPLVTGPTQDFAPLYSRDGTRMAFWRASTPRESTLMIASADGSGVRPVLQAPLTDADWFEWSPDDRSLAVVHAIDGARVLSIVDVDKGTLRTLDTGGLVVDNSVYWRPGTASKLLFSSHAGSDAATTAGIFSINADGTGLTPVVPTVVGLAELIDLDLSPDGQSLTYWRWEQAEGSRIHRFDIATGVDQELRFDPTSKGETGLVHSPDGSTVLFQREDLAAQVMIAPADASRPGILVGRPFDMDVGPSSGFSPDGKTVFIGFENEQPQFFDAATGATKTGPSTPADCCSWQRLAP